MGECMHEDIEETLITTIYAYNYIIASSNDIQTRPVRIEQWHIHSSRSASPPQPLHWSESVYKP
jgi:hypothetical protein